MCLIVIAHGMDRDFPLIVAGNRDEFHGRPTQDAHWWPDRPNVLGGRDLQANGTWLALHRNGRFAAVTNHRDAVPPSANLQSRGHLVSDFLASGLSPPAFVDQVDADRYGGFNLFVSDTEQLAYLSNRGGGCRELPPGIYGVANATLDATWPKVQRSTHALRDLIRDRSINVSQLLTLLADRQKARVSDVQADELPFDAAHALSAPFVVMPEYGTRCSTVVLRGADGRVSMTEKRFTADGQTSGQSDFRFDVSLNY